MSKIPDFIVVGKSTRREKTLAKSWSDMATMSALTSGGLLPGILAPICRSSTKPLATFRDRRLSLWLETLVKNPKEMFWAKIEYVYAIVTNPNTSCGDEAANGKDAAHEIREAPVHRYQVNYVFFLQSSFQVRGGWEEDSIQKHFQYDWIQGRGTGYHD